MIDFSLADNGDLDIKTAVKFPAFKLDFKINPQQTLLVTFDTNLKQIKPEPKNLFKITFDIDLHREHKSISNTTIKDKAELAQAVAIRLKTELGEMDFLKTLGSELVLMRHEDLKSDTVLENVKTYVSNAVSDILEDYTINVARVESEGNLRLGTLNIEIINADNEIIFTGQV